MNRQAAQDSSSGQQPDALTCLGCHADNAKHQQQHDSFQRAGSKAMAQHDCGCQITATGVAVVLRGVLLFEIAWSDALVSDRALRCCV
jgi:hypothetical protein